MVLLSWEVNLPITLLEGWLQSELMVGNWETPQNEVLSGPGLVHESLVQRKVMRFLLVTS